MRGISAPFFLLPPRCGAKLEQISQSRPESSLGWSHFQCEVSKPISSCSLLARQRQGEQGRVGTPFSLPPPPESKHFGVNGHARTAYPRPRVSGLSGKDSESVPAHCRLWSAHLPQVFWVVIPGVSLGSGDGCWVPPALTAASNRPFQVLDLYRRSPESGEVCYQARQLEKTICPSRAGGWAAGTRGWR